jgi:hypothetical protein
VSEAALGHTDQNAVRAAYRRTRLLDERVDLMQRWSDFVCGHMPALPRRDQVLAEEEASPALSH